MQPRRIHAVVLDLDDTLYLERLYVRSGYRAVTRHLCRNAAAQAEMESWLWRRFLSGASAGAFDAMDRQFNLQLGSGGVAEMVELYRAHTPEISPLAGMPELLRTLRTSRRLGLLSDGFLPAQQLKLGALGLGELFDVTLFTESLGRGAWKPSRIGFEHVRHELATPHASCAYIADNPAKDFVAPNELGWLTIQLKCDGQIHSDKPAPPGGGAQLVALGIGELADMLNNPPPTR
jgi:putative hydrolase of the HAD superfamily